MGYVCLYWTVKEIVKSNKPQHNGCYMSQDAHVNIQTHLQESEVFTDARTSVQPSLSGPRP